MAIEFESGIGNDTLIQAWRGPESTAGVINKGFRVIMADYTYFYLVRLILSELRLTAGLRTGRLDQWQPRQGQPHS